MRTHLLLLTAIFVLPSAVAAESPLPKLPDGLRVGQLLYDAKLDDANSIEGWQMEGPGEVTFQDGWMEMRSPDEKMHHVFWCPEEFPENFVASWQAQNLNAEAGLCIVFFAAAGTNGEHVLNEQLPQRDGTFSQYTQGAIRCYHSSYYANDANDPDRQHTNLRKNPGFHLVQKGAEGIPTNSKAAHTITLAKQDAHIRLWVDDRKVIDWTDDGSSGGGAHDGGSIGFRQMQWTHFRYRNFRVWASETPSDPVDRASEEAVNARRQQLRQQAAAEPLDLKSPNPKLVFPFIAARFAMGQFDPDCIEYLSRGVQYRGKDAHFGIASLAWIVAKHRDQLPPQVLEDIRAAVREYPEFLSGGTENHRALKRAAGLIYGEIWPDDTFHHGITGRELARVCKQYVRDYGRDMFATSMREYLSPTYHVTNSAPWLMLAEVADDEETRIMARAIVDWMMADLALNCHHGVIVPPLTRDKSWLQGDAGGSRLTLSPTLDTAWLYWGSDEPVEARTKGSSSPFHAAASYMPHPAIRNLGAKQIALPFQVRQSRPSGRALEDITANQYGYEVREEPELFSVEPRYHLRSAYIDRNYAVGVGSYRKNYPDSMLRTLIPFGAVWKSHDEFAQLMIGHPYWYVNYKPEPWPSASPQDMWSGVSPFGQAVHHENAAILLFDIPEIDPYSNKKLRWGPEWARPQPFKNPIQSCFAYFPDSVDERVHSDAGFFLREGETYIAILPLQGNSQWSDSAIPSYSRIDMPGAITGCVVEMGDREEYGTFEDFQHRVAAQSLDTSRLIEDQQVSYISTRGHSLKLKFNDDGWFPHASVNGQVIDFERWPIFEGQYVNCTDRLLEVHDGRQGFSIDWRGEVPVSTHFQITGEKRRVVASPDNIDLRDSDSTGGSNPESQASQGME